MMAMKSLMHCRKRSHNQRRLRGQGAERLSPPQIHCQVFVLENILLPCPFLSLLTSALTRSHLFCAVTLPDSESDAQSPRRDTNRMWYRDDDHNDLRMRHSNRIAATGLPLSRVQLLQQIEIKESSLKAALAHNEVVEKKEMCYSEFCSCLHLCILHIFFLACEQGAQFSKVRSLGGDSGSIRKHAST